jgi:predicted RNase H-like nuclease
VTAVLGIDAAWTARNASGFALIEKRRGAWRLQAAGPNVAAFSLRCGIAAEGQGMIDGLACAKTLLGYAPDLIAVDMPMSKTAIIGRRASDLGVSRRFGAAKCATHSPSAERPGNMSGVFRAACEQAGYELIVSSGALPALSLAEVYPHPALLRLLGLDRRAPYKVGKTRTYWPEASRDERFVRVKRSLLAIVEALDELVAGVRDEIVPSLDAAQGFAGLKPVEDTIDAIVCAWVGATILAGDAEPIGDADSAIWVPISSPAQRGRATMRSMVEGASEPGVYSQSPQAPSTALRAVPLPRGAGEEKGAA